MYTKYSKKREMYRKMFINTQKKEKLYENVHEIPRKKKNA